MARNNEIPEVNAGSMADIAFLLLIFFLVTTTIQTDMGLDRKLPPEETPPPPKIHEKNIFRVNLNKNDQLMVEGELMSYEHLRSAAIAFLDNGGDPKDSPNYCGHCMGERSAQSSDNPTEAVISLNSDRGASYGMYITVQNELTAAYNELRNREANRLFGQDYVTLEDLYFDPETDMEEKKGLKAKITQIRNMYPMKLSEAETKNIN